MRASESRARNGLRLISAAVAVVLLMGACNRGERTESRRTSKSPSPTATKAKKSPTPSEGPGEGAGGAAPAASPTAAAPTQGPPLQATSVQPTAPGKYLYNESGKSTINCGTPQEQKPPSPTTLVVDTPGGNRQQSIRDRRRDNGQGIRTTSVFEFRDDGIYLAFLRQEQSTPVGSDSSEFEPNPPVLVLPKSPTPGHQWAFTLNSNDGRVKVDVYNTIEAVDDPVKIADGSTVPATRIKSTRHVTGQSNLGTVDITENATTWVSLQHRLIVRDVSDAEGRIGVSCTTSSHIEQLIRSTSPS
ncbi:MAG: hypothetical protein ACRDI1_01740 [Actinomycetota bacterium]